MKIILYVLLMFSIIIVAFACSKLPGISERYEKKRASSMYEKEQYYIENIYTTEILIKHIGIQDKPIYSILFKCNDDVNVNKLEYNFPKSPNQSFIGYTILLNSKEFKSVLDIIFSRSTNDINKPDVPSDYGTFMFSTYDKNKKTIFVYDKNTSIGIIKEISNVLRKYNENEKALDTILWRLRD